MRPVPRHVEPISLSAHQMRSRLALIVVVTALFGVTSAQADPPPWAGGGKGQSEKAKGKGKGHDRGEERPQRKADPRNAHFADDHRIVVREYYEEQHRHGKCPPGLAKKRNGCMPPGQAKKWRVGRPLPRDVVYYDLPAGLIVKLGTPPPGHRYVRIAADILLIAIGTSMVVDAIEDLGRM